ncbi:MAG: AglZ/HisF2 family acetamidino modification protein [Bdellovibrionota bacterium]
MITRRVVPCLLLSGKKLVKTIKFGDAKYIGDPINAVKIFNDKEVDEIMILDIEASVQQKPPQFEYLSEVVSESFVPISYGGGINSLEHIDKLLQMGIEKVCLNSVNAKDFELITEASKKYGAQSVVGVIDIKKTLLGRNEIYFKNKKLSINMQPVEFAQSLQEFGAGEVLLNFVDRDGTYKGYDLELTKEISNRLKIPIVVVGGAGSVEDFKRAFHAGANAVSAGSLFVYHGPHKAVLINYPTRKQIEDIIFNKD